MGLDMYLYAESYISGWNHGKGPDPLYQTLLDHFRMERNEDSPHAEVSLCVGYWRKVNAVHNWFVQNCGGGVDECQKIYVSREKLHELYTLCKKVLANKENPEEHLPPVDGFFFGGTEIDEWYWQGIQYTHDLIEGLLNRDDLDTFYYQASW